MNHTANKDSEKNDKDIGPKVYYVHNDIVFITEYVAIDSDEPLEIIQCCLDVGEDLRKNAIAIR